MFIKSMAFGAALALAASAQATVFTVKWSCAASHPACRDTRVSLDAIEAVSSICGRPCREEHWRPLTWQRRAGDEMYGSA